MDWLRRFMYGRYGTDLLNRILTIAPLVLVILSSFTGWAALNGLALLCLAAALYRTFSHDIIRRRRENQAVQRLLKRVPAMYARCKTRFAQRKTHCFFKCKVCGTSLRVPKGRGRMVITCPKCHNAFEERT